MTKQKSPKVRTALKHLRLASNQTLDEVAKATRTTRSHIWALEMDRVQDPGISTLISLANHYGCSLDAIVGRTEEITAGREPEPIDKLLFSAIRLLDIDKKIGLLQFLSPPAEQKNIANRFQEAPSSSLTGKQP